MTAVPIDAASWRGPLARGGTLTTALTLVFLAALFALCHPYEGIVGDANVYIGRILADADPGGLGRDLLFANDGQSRFSLFRVIAGPLVLALGASRAAMLLAGLAELCWFAALVALAQGLARGRTAWAIVLAVTILPAGYGDTGHFAFAEANAIPRPFAEAAVMAALAAILARRWIAAGVLLLLATALHPIMALAGLGVAAVLASWTLSPGQRRAIAAGAVVAAASAVSLGLCGVPLFDRVVHRIDPDWLGMIAARAPHLFPTLWSADAWPVLATQLGTIAIAARSLSGQRRHFLVAAAFIGVAGVAASVLLSDTLHLVLFVQLQTWRATWLVGVVAGGALALCAVPLWHRDNTGRLVLAMVVFAWLFRSDPAVPFAAIALAVGLEFGTAKRRLKLDDRLVVAICAALGAVLLYATLGRVLGYLAFLKSLPADDPPRFADPIRNGLQTVPLVLLAALWLLGPPLSRRWATPLLAAAALLLGAAAVGLWDQRTAAARTLEEPAPVAFQSAVGGPATEVLWLDGLAEAWFGLHRPQYFSPQQAVGAVFSRPLAMAWRGRARTLMALGLVRRNVLTPFQPTADDDRLRVSSASIGRLCRSVDAPGTIVLPIENGTPPPERAIDVWHLASPRFVYEGHGSSVEVHKVTGYAAIPCHPAAP